jgi:hypothetical protein
MHQLDPAPRVDQAAKLLEQLRQRLLEDPTDSRVQRDLLRVERSHRALLEYQRDLDERRAPTVEVPADGDPGSILDRYPTSPGSESLPEDYWQVREYGFRQEAFEDSIVLIGYELRKPVSRPAKDFYIAVFAMLSSLKTQSMGSKLFAQHLEGRFEQLATDPEVRSEMEMARMQAKKGGKSPALPSKKLRELMLVESSLRVAEVWGREPLVKMALIYLVSLFEGCLVNIVAEAIEADERLLYSSKKPLDSKELLTLTSLD